MRPSGSSRRLRVALVGLADPLDPDAGDRLSGLGIAYVVPAEAPAADVASAVSEAVGAMAHRRRDIPDRPVRPGAVPADPVSERTWPADPAGALSHPRHGPSSGAPHPVGGRGVAVPGGRGRIVAVWGPSGAPGRTTVALTLAGELAALGGQTLIVDADTYGPSVAQALGLLDESGGIAGAVRSANHAALDVGRLARLALSLSPTLRVLTGLPQPSRWPELRPSGLEVLWQRARDLARWTVVDCGFGLEADEEITFDTAAPRRNGATLSALAAADVVLAVGGAEPIGLQRLVRGLSDLADVLGPAVRPRVVVTRVRAEAVGRDPGRRIAEALARYAGVRDVLLVPDDRAACDAVMLAGRTLVEMVPGSPARRAVGALALSLETSLENETAAAQLALARSS